MSPMADDDKAPYQPEWVTKVDVARRQIVAAIRMFFERTDPIVAHSVISAGHQVLTDVGAKSGIDGLLRGRTQSREGRVKWNTAANFFKHADNDPHARLNVEPLPELNGEFLMDAVLLLQNISGDLPIEAKIFWSWFVGTREELFENVSPEVLPRLPEMGLDPNNFQDIAEFLRFADLEEHLMNEHGVSLVDVLPKIRASLLREGEEEPKAET